MSWLRRHQSLAPEKPLRDELLSIERLEERALALAASFTVDPNPRRAPADTFPRFEDNVRVLRAAYRTLADDVRNGQFVVLGRGLAARQLPPGRGRDLRHPPESAARVLAHAADAGVARARRSRPHLRDRGRADPPQRQPPRSPAADPVPEQLPARRAADDRRAVGVAEHAEAGADREPAPAGRGAAGRARRPPRGRHLRRESGRSRRRGGAAAGHRPGVHRPAAAPPARVRPSPVGDSRRRRTTTSRRATPQPRRPSAASTSVRAWRRSRSRTPSPACACARRWTGRSTSRPSASSNRCCSAIRPARTDAWTS